MNEQTNTPPNSNRNRLLVGTGVVAAAAAATAVALMTGNGKSANTNPDAASVAPHNTVSATSSDTSPQSTASAISEVPTPPDASAISTRISQPTHSVVITPKAKPTTHVSTHEAPPVSPSTPEKQKPADLTLSVGDKPIALNGQELLLTPQVALWDRPFSEGNAKRIAGDNYQVLNARIIEGEDAACFTLPTKQVACINLGDESSTKHIQIGEFKPGAANPDFVPFSFQELKTHTVVVSAVENGEAFYQNPSDPFANQSGQAPIAQVQVSGGA